MSRNDQDQRATVTLGDDVVVIRYPGRSQPIVAGLLGHESDGVHESLYLDRLVHRPTQDRIGIWTATGAVTTILQRLHTEDRT